MSNGWGYNPEDAKRPVIDPGTYPATIVAATHKRSSTDKPMVELIFKVYTEEGERQLWDYMVCDPKAIWKLENLANALGQEDVFATGTFDPAKYVNHNVMVQVVIKKATGQYPESNSIKGYERKPSANAPSAARAPVPAGHKVGPGGVVHPAIEDDQIPF